MAQVKCYALPIDSFRKRDDDHGIKGVSGTRVGLTIGEAEAPGTFPAVMCTVRTTNKGVRGFVRCCRQRSVSVRECRPGALAAIPDEQEVLRMVAESGSATFECIGGLEHLEYLTGHPSVVRWGYIEQTAGGVDCRASGAGKKK